MQSKILIVFLSCFFSSSYAAVQKGLRDQPIKIAIIPTHQANKALNNGSDIAKCFEKESKLFFDLIIPNNNMAVVEALGAKRVDVVVGDNTTFFAAKKFGVKPILQVSHHGFDHYESMIIATKKSGIKSLEDLKGKKFSFACSDKASISSCILPLYELSKLGLIPYKELIAGTMDTAIAAVLQGKVDLAGAFHSAAELDKKGQVIKIRDARRNVVKTFPKVIEETNIIWLSEDIPNEPVIVREDLSDDIVEILKKTLPICFRRHPGINDIDDLIPITKKGLDRIDELFKIVHATGIDFAQIDKSKSKKNPKSN